MRILLKVTIPVEAGNDQVRAGTMGQKLKSIAEELKPESFYCIEMGGCRTVIVVVNVTDESQIPLIAEPFFLAFDAKVEMHPAMVPGDFLKSEAALEATVKKYGSKELVAH